MNVWSNFKSYSNESKSKYDSLKLSQLFGSANKNFIYFGLWKISTIMGHISPEETLSNYIHMLELFVGYFYWAISQKEENLYNYFGKFNSKRVIAIIPTLNNDRSVRKAKFRKYNNNYSFYSIAKFVDKKLHIESIF